MAISVALGTPLRRKASASELRSAYRRLAKRVHPDKTRDDRATKAFDVLRDCYDLLNDDRKRQRYDAQLKQLDEQRRERRRRQRAATRRAVYRGLRASAEAAWQHKRVSLAVVVLLYLRFGLSVGADVSIDPAQQPLPSLQAWRVVSVR